MISTVPPGRGLFVSLSRHFVPGYYRPVPPGQKPFAHRAPRIILALMGMLPRVGQIERQIPGVVFKYFDDSSLSNLHHSA